MSESTLAHTVLKVLHGSNFLLENAVVAYDIYFIYFFKKVAMLVRKPKTMSTRTILKYIDL